MVLVGLRHPVEVDGFGGAATIVGVSALEALVLLNHSNDYSCQISMPEGLNGLIS
jgi:hypothetical protein